MSKEIRATRQYYNTHGALWMSTHNDAFWHEPQLTALMKHLKRGASLLDIGCAHGIHVPFFLGIGRGIRYEEMDISNTLIRVARRHYPQLSFHSGNIAEKKTLPQKKYAAFIASAVFMHIPFKHWDTAFTNLESLIKPKGVGFITLPVDRTNSMDTKTDTRHFTYLSEKDQVTYLKNRGWNILKHGYAHGTKKNDVWRWYLVELP